MLPLILKNLIFLIGMTTAGIFMFKDKRKGIFFGVFSTFLSIVMDFLLSKFS